MRIRIEFAARVLDLDLTLSRPAPDDGALFEPVPQGSTCGLLDGAGTPGEDVRMPIGTTMPMGFQATTRGTS